MTQSEAEPEVPMETSKVIIELQPDYSIEEIVADYSKYSLERKSKVSKTLNAHLFHFNSQSIADKELLLMLRADSNVVNARLMKIDPDLESSSTLTKMGKKSLKSVK